ncbi:hypothetical protein ACYT6T_09925, partial [Streptococcus pyogenes]
DGMEIMDKIEVKKEIKQTFKLPDFANQTKISVVALGSAIHELMQRLQLSQKISMTDLEKALDQVQASEQVKQSMDLTKILSFFDSDL